ncbi:lysozyme inhibitor LprI family protein [Paracoccus saliphilus]|uniref:DUF1311 domain-containing protein n=1 Tax=Paracoccus saliphilus TaxID=405559 RepID=A0AA45W3V0_9RHOB|nr:lysozyme inhibitor LprI family protein [Paracoccus saliphilus]WCR04331.1 DUF1311 domain-containing protein [Paracoccus saliphilus]SIS79505.1 Protein of unknown function [Paracoccus saliphilus]
MKLTRSITIAAFAINLNALPVFAGDASGLDPAAIDQCIEAGEGGDCADAGMQACREYAETKYTGDDPDFVEKNCLDASHQAWEAKLSDIYQALLDKEGDAGIKPQEMLRQTEHAWIGFRDSLCNYAMEAAKAREAGGDLARLKCQRDEAARHWALLNTRLEGMRE